MPRATLIPSLQLFFCVVKQEASYTCSRKSVSQEPENDKFADLESFCFYSIFALECFLCLATADMACLSLDKVNGEL